MGADSSSVGGPLPDTVNYINTHMVKHAGGAIATAWSPLKIITLVFLLLGLLSVMFDLFAAQPTCLPELSGLWLGLLR